MSIESLNQRNIEIAGIIFNGQSNSHSESIILSYGGCKSLLHLEPNSQINTENVRLWAKELRTNLEKDY